MCGTLAGMARRLGSAAAVSPRAYMWPSQHGCFRVVGRGNSEIQELVFKRMMWKLRIFLWPFLRSHWVPFLPNLLVKTVTSLNQILEKGTGTPSLVGEWQDHTTEKHVKLGYCCGQCWKVQSATLLFVLKDGCLSFTPILEVLGREHRLNSAVKIVLFN